MSRRESRLRHRRGGRRDGYGVLVGVEVVGESGRCRLGVGIVWLPSCEALFLLILGLFGGEAEEALEEAHDGVWMLEVGGWKAGEVRD